MGKKHKHPEHENLERWLVSYADFITLLFATFVVLYAISQADLAKFKQVSQSIQQAFNPAKSIMEEPGGVLKGTPDSNLLPKSGNSILDKIMPKPDGSGGKGKSENAGLEPLKQTVSELNRKTGSGGSGGKSGEQGHSVPESITIKLQERGLVISMASSLFFAPASAGLKPQAFQILDDLAKQLKPSGLVIHIEGHTDSQPMFSAVYPSNWELSTARASSVLRYFVQKHQFDPHRMAAVGYADTRPVADNANAEGRAKNRRVDIVLLAPQVAQTADAGPAQENEKPLVLSKESNGAAEPEHDAEMIEKRAKPQVAPEPIQVKPAPVSHAHPPDKPKHHKADPKPHH